jgi:hypothetical protein
VNEYFFTWELKVGIYFQILHRSANEHAAAAARIMGAAAALKRRMLLQNQVGIVGGFAYLVCR